MRVTKSWLKHVKGRLETAIKEVCRMDRTQLIRTLREIWPNLVAHETGCPNCGMEPNQIEQLGRPTASPVFTCRCTPAERAMAMADTTPTELIRQILMAKLDALIPDHEVC